MKQTIIRNRKGQPICRVASKINILFLVAVGLLTACSDDDNAVIEDTTEETYALEIATVTIDSDATGESISRVAESSEGSGSIWEAGDEFYVQFEGYDDTGTYQVTNDAADTITAVTSIDWPSITTAHDIVAWYAPEADDDGTVDLSDQSSSPIYVLRAEQTATYDGSGISLQFANQLAKVRVMLEGDLAIGVSTIYLVSYTTCTQTQGTVSDGGYEGYISMYKTTYNGETCWEANVVPDHQITTLLLNTNIEKTLTTDFTPAAGTINTITLTVEGDYIYDEISDTYTVSNTEGLMVWANAATTYSSTNCTLTADISVEGETWPHITYYNGTFDGQGHTISGLEHSNPSAYTGFIGSLRSSGAVKNLTLADASIEGGNYTGGIVGYLSGGTIEGCSYRGTVGGGMDVGGIVGEMERGTIVACYATADVTATERYAGGIVGTLNSGVVAACYHATGTLTASSYVGGIAGNSVGTITACYWSGEVSAGIGAGSSGEATEVTGDTDWEAAAAAMNTYLEDYGSDWLYTTEGATTNIPLILTAAD